MFRFGINTITDKSVIYKDARWTATAYFISKLQLIAAAVQLNITTLIGLCRLAIPGMVKRGNGGSINRITSCVSKDNFYIQNLYVAERIEINSEIEEIGFTYSEHRKGNSIKAYAGKCTKA